MICPGCFLPDVDIKKGVRLGVHLFLWTRWDSNPRSLRCERSAFPAKLRARNCLKTGSITGSKGARTPDLSRVRRTLIPAELCFRLLTRFILPLYQKESSPNENFCYIFSDFSPAHIRTCRYGPDGYAFGCLEWRSFASGAGAQVSISFSMSSFLT